jgi:hypothetical protein
MDAERASTPSTAHLRCRPPEIETGATAEETLARYQQALVELAQCFDDELTIRPSSSLLSLVVIKIIVPFVAISTALSTLYATIILRADARFEYSEYALGVAHFVLALTAIALWVLFRRTPRLARAHQLRDHIRDYLQSLTPRRNETLTRNHVVNDWIYFWFVFGVVFAIPFVFFLLRVNALDRVGMQVIVDTAGICHPGTDGISFYRGSRTCASIAGAASTAQSDRAEAAEIRLDVTTTLAFYVIVQVTGISAAMAYWWWRNRTSGRASRSNDRFDLRHGLE